jgi:hypothetical protein
MAGERDPHGPMDGASMEEEIQDLSKRLQNLERSDRSSRSANVGALKKLFNSPIFAAALSLVAVAMTVVNLTMILGGGSPLPTRDQTQDHLMEMLLFAVEYVEDHRAEKERLPRDLDDIQFSPEVKVLYEKFASGDYEIVISNQETKVVYDSKDGPRKVFGHRWSGEEAAR